MKTVLIYLPNLHCGGAESVTVRLANFLASSGFAVKLITSIGGGVLRDTLDSNIEYIDLGLKNQWLTLFKMPFLIRKVKPDIIFTTMKESCFIMILSKYLAFSNAKLLIREANTVSLQLKEEDRPIQKIKNYLIGFSYRFADEIIALSDEIKNDLMYSFNIKKNINVIPNPINFEKIESERKELINCNIFLEKASGLKLVTVARFYPQKNHLFMLEALAEYIIKYGDIKWYLVGDGPLKDEIKYKADSLGILNNIVFLGFQKNPIAIVNACDIFVLPSIYEGFSNALLEAAALNKKIIVSDAQTTSIAFLKKIKTGVFYKNNNVTDFCHKLKLLSIENENYKTSQLMKNTYNENAIFNSYIMLICS